MGKGKKIDGKATDVARKIWRQVGYCEANDVPDSVWVCKSVEAGNTSPQLQGAHIFGVGRYRRLQADLRNGLSLCSNCHRTFTDGPTDFTEFIKHTKYKKYLKPLKDKQNGPKVKVFWDEKLEELKDILKQIQAGELTVDEARQYES